jgi:phage-related baseplate assembly protein
MNRLGIIEPEKLPYFAVLETIATEDVIKARMTRLKELWKEYDPPIAANYDVEILEFDPIVINQQACTYFELMMRDRVNQACRAVTTAYAIDGDLDNIASRYPGGVPRLPDEDDDRYRRRIWLSPATLSPHGTEEAYVFWALTADTTLHDASATTREGTGQVNITIMPNYQYLWRDRQRASSWTSEYVGPSLIPTTAQLLAVRAYLHDFSRKGLTDMVSVLPPRQVKTRFVLDVWLFPGMDAPTVMGNLRRSLQDLIKKQSWLGWDFTRMAIATASGNVTGVQNVHILEPERSIAADLRTVVEVTDIELIFRGHTE